MEATSKLYKVPLHADEGSRTVTDIRAKCRRLKRKAGLKLVVVDYMQLMQGRSRENRQQEIAEISLNLKALARELDVPVIAVSQLNRALEARQDKRPQLGDLRESGAIEQDADVVLMIYRDEYSTRTPGNWASLRSSSPNNGPDPPAWSKPPSPTSTPASTTSPTATPTPSASKTGGRPHGVLTEDWSGETPPRRTGLPLVGSGKATSSTAAWFQACRVGAAPGGAPTSTGDSKLRSMPKNFRSMPKNYRRTKPSRQPRGTRTRRVPVTGVTDRGQQQPPNAPAASTSSNADPKPPPRG